MASIRLSARTANPLPTHIPHTSHAMKTARDIERRLTLLEAISRPPLDVQIRTLTGGDVAAVSCGGRRWERAEGESAEQLHQRARAAAARSAGQAVRVFIEHTVGACKWPLMAA